MDGFSISQAAERTGFPASTLRFYEKSGLLRPDRTQAGYRSYNDRHMDVLSFIGRAKGFGLSLDEITELLTLLEEGRCAPVQGRLRDLVDTKIAGVREKAAELDSFAKELTLVAAALDRHTPDGPCDEICGCTTDQQEQPGHTIHMGVKPHGVGDPVIACTLDANDVDDRFEQWRELVAGAVLRDPIPGGIRVGFDRSTNIGEISALMAAEQECCRFFTFTLTVEVDCVTLDVTGPPEAQQVVEALVG